MVFFQSYLEFMLSEVAECNETCIKLAQENSQHLVTLPLVSQMMPEKRAQKIYYCTNVKLSILIYFLFYVGSVLNRDNL